MSHGVRSCKHDSPTMFFHMGNHPPYNDREMRCIADDMEHKPLCNLGAYFVPSQVYALVPTESAKPILHGKYPRRVIHHGWFNNEESVHSPILNSQCTTRLRGPYRHTQSSIFRIRLVHRGTAPQVSVCQPRDQKRISHTWRVWKTAV